MRITMYELLGLVKNGKAPKKIRFNNNIYEYHDKEHGYCRYYHDNTYISLHTDYYLFDILNDEVEVLKEEPYVEICGNWFTKDEYNNLFHCEKEKKIPEKLKFDEIVLFRNSQDIVNMLKMHASKINEIIDYLKSKGDKYL